MQFSKVPLISVLSATAQDWQSHNASNLIYNALDDFVELKAHTHTNTSKQRRSEELKVLRDLPLVSIYSDICHFHVQHLCKSRHMTSSWRTFLHNTTVAKRILMGISEQGQHQLSSVVVAVVNKIAIRP